MIRERARRVLDRQMVRRTVPVDAIDLERPAVVLAPHPDDETLGAGGLIALKRQAGVPVTVVFLTDGSSSHAHLMPRAALTARRREEATAACRLLGVTDGDVTFLPFVDGALTASARAAAGEVARLLDATGATQIVVPHPHEPPADHSVVPAIAEAALSAVGRAAQALMYPVWMWDQWPWTGVLSPPRSRRRDRDAITGTVRGAFGVRASRQFTHRLDIRQVVERKRAALGAHATQMTRADGTAGWLTLTDVAGGDWLRQLTGPTEFYTMTTLGPAGHSP